MEKTRQLFEILRYMKEECRYYPFSLALVEDRVWESDTLADLQAPSRQAYFMPLGYLDPGAYQLLFEGLGDSSNSCIEIIDGEFDFIATDSVHGRGENKKTLFRIREHSEYFLRIAAQVPINITRVELVTIEKKGATDRH